MADPDSRDEDISVSEPRPTLPPVTLADSEEDQVEQGRIGYGRYGKWTPLGLAILLLLTILVLGIVSVLNDDEGGPSADRPAPDFDLVLLDGSTFRLSDYQGKVVVVNFWASWCEPCKTEMPILQQAAITADPDVVFLGIGAKRDTDDAAKAFLATYEVTYLVGRDTAGGDEFRGGLEQVFGLPGYPATLIIDGDGQISTTVFGPLEPGELEGYIADAQS